MAQFKGRLKKFYNKVSKNNKPYQRVFFETTEGGTVIDLFNWGNPVTDEMVGNWYTVSHSEGQFAKIEGLNPTEPPTQQTQVSTQQPNAAESQPQVSKPATQPAQAHTTANLHNSAQYLAMRLAVQLVVDEQIQVDDKPARLSQHYEYILGELKKATRGA